MINVLINQKLQRYSKMDRIMAQPPPQSPRLAQVNVNEVMEKMASKRDVYNFLTLECEAYLPKVDTVNIFFLKQITRGTKDVSPLPPHPLVCSM